MGVPTNPSMPRPGCPPADFGYDERMAISIPPVTRALLIMNIAIYAVQASRVRC